METVLIFLIFLAPLIFFHELGHFLFARYFGVKVETFSIGFGPKILKYKKGDTDYTISLIPLGGYVKMFGDDPLNSDKLTAEEREHAFTFKSKWARFWIVLGGPLANFLLAFILFFALALSGEKVPEAKFGYVQYETDFHKAGFRTGDRIVGLNGEELTGLTDLSMHLENDNVFSLSVMRQGAKLTIPFEKKGKEFLMDFMGLMGLLRKPILVDIEGNRYVISKKPSEFSLETSIEEFEDYQGNLFVIPVDFNKETSEHTLKPNAEIIKLAKRSNPKEKVSDLVRQEKLFFLDVLVKKIVRKSPADTAKIRAGYIITKINDENVYSFEDLRLMVQETKNNALKVEYLNTEGSLLKTDMVPDVSEDGKRKTIGIFSSGEFITPQYVQSEGKSFFEGIIVGAKKTWDTTVSTAVGFKKLITGETSMKNIGGPIAIGKVAKQSLDISFTYFLSLMALVSINLGVINLVPIPVLDGGHIMFIFFEIINRGPLSRKKMEFALRAGLSLLLLLIVAALVNDISRL